MLSRSWRCALAIGLAGAGFGASAQDRTAFEHEIWLATGFRSHHTGQGGPYNERNAGAGIEWRFSTDWQLNAGRYRNSMSRHSTYLQAAWTPFALPLPLPAHAQLRGGASVGAVNGYPGAMSGGWFPTLVPAITLEWQRVGVNLLYIPSVGKRVEGAVALQLKIRAI